MQGLNLSWKGDLWKAIFRLIELANDLDSLTSDAWEMWQKTTRNQRQTGNERWPTNCNRYPLCTLHVGSYSRIKIYKKQITRHIKTSNRSDSATSVGLSRRAALVRLTHEKGNSKTNCTKLPDKVAVCHKVCLSQELSFCLTKHPPSLFRLTLVVAKVFSALKLAFGLCQSGYRLSNFGVFHFLSFEDDGMTMLTRFRKFCIWCWTLLKAKWTISLLQPKFLWVQSQLFTTENHASLFFTWKPGNEETRWWRRWWDKESPRDFGSMLSSKPDMERDRDIALQGFFPIWSCFDVFCTTLQRAWSVQRSIPTSQPNSCSIHTASWSIALWPMGSEIAVSFAAQSDFDFSFLHVFFVSYFDWPPIYCAFVLCPL